MTGFRRSDAGQALLGLVCEDWSQATSLSEEDVEEIEYCDETQSLVNTDEVDEEAEDAIEDS